MSNILSSGSRAHHGVLVAGDAVRWRGERYSVLSLEGVRVQLAPRPGSGLPLVTVPLGLLAAADDFAVLDAEGQPVSHGALPDWSRLEGIVPEVAREAYLWERHIIEVDTGLLPNMAEDATPREGYAPEQFTLIERYKAKALELNAVLDWDVSWHTVQRKRLLYREKGIWGLVDKRRTRTPSLFGRTDSRVVDALLALVAARAGKAAITASALFVLLRRSVHASYGKKVVVPPNTTLYKLLDRLGISVRDLRAPTRRRLEAAGRPAPSFSVTTALAPGELVQIDSTDLDVKVLGDDGQPTSVELTAMVDVATRSIIAAVIRAKTTRGKRRAHDEKLALFATPRRAARATKAVDASLLLARALVPAPMRPGFSALAHASASDLPFEELLEADPRMAQAASRPVIVPDLIVIDHGTVFAGRTFFDACQSLGISVRPARRRTPTDKAIVERTFGSIKSLFSQHVNTYTGNDITRRARTMDGEVLYNLSQLDDLLQAWIALGWQRRRHEELQNPYDANLPTLSPNQMFSACVQVAGYLPVPLSREDYLRLLPTAWIGVSDEGIRFMNRTYENAQGGLDPYRRRRSGLGGKRRGGWELRYNPYAPERVWLHDHENDTWVEAAFRHQKLIDAPWTQYLWDIATTEHLQRGGRKDDEFAIAQALADLLERAGRGPEQAQAAAVPDGWEPGALPAPRRAVFDPYGDDASPAAGGVLDLPDDGMYELPGPSDLSRRTLSGDALFLTPSQLGQQEWSPEATEAFKAAYFDDLPPLDEKEAAECSRRPAAEVADEEELFRFLGDDLKDGDPS
ncbi:DDE-type integrase/transposase/recombinase [Streptomyces albidoflavus]|uniref:DDE-type integrase/transposase/recombinase n=1 Tax=Streptomyces sp. N1 TaxID=576456 RepID=UPI0010132836|nr:DDE-type integrase/transposase/recombinase [Streptomyces sp. N1]